MPLYDYRCRACSKVTEVRHGFREPHRAACPECGGELARVFHPAGIVFKGSGFYLTDSRKAAETAKSSASKATESKPSSEPSKPAETTNAAESTSSPAAPAPAASTPAPAPGASSAPKNSESSAA